MIGELQSDVRPPTFSSRNTKVTKSIVHTFCPLLRRDLREFQVPKGRKQYIYILCKYDYIVRVRVQQWIDLFEVESGSFGLNYDSMPYWGTQERELASSCGEVDGKRRLVMDTQKNITASV